MALTGGIGPGEVRTWVESDSAQVSTPAGTFDGCLLMRASVSMRSERPQYRYPVDAPEAETGEWWCWLARGVGPVAHRHERGDGVVEHSVLAEFHCPERRQEWMPLVVGTRWVYQAAEPPLGVDTRVAFSLTPVRFADRHYLVHASLARPLAPTA